MENEQIGEEQEEEQGRYAKHAKRRPQDGLQQGSDPARRALCHAFSLPGRELDRPPTIEHMTVERMDHVGIVVDDLPAAIEFFTELGLEIQGQASIEGRWVDRIVGLDGVRSDIAMLQTPDGHNRLELTKFHSPPAQDRAHDAPANTPGIRHIAFAIDDIDTVVDGLRALGAELIGELERYENSYRLCYVRGPEGIIIELAERIG
jgi:catechol 2,3-dioxygenase-like lactoylglutathione lyase family enzyme